jgi:hypothetical protein
LSAEAVHASAKDVDVTADAARPLGVVGAVVSADVDVGTNKAADGVVTDKAEDGAETLPAASTADTVKEYGTPAESPLIEADVPLGEATCVPPRYTR